MPVLHQYTSRDGIYLKSNIDGSFITLQTTDKAESFLRDLGYSDGDSVSWHLIRPLWEQDHIYTGGSGPSKSVADVPTNIPDGPGISKEERRRLKQFLSNGSLPDDVCQYLLNHSPNINSKRGAVEAVSAISPRVAVVKSLRHLCGNHPVNLDRIKVSDNALGYYVSTAAVQWLAYDNRWNDRESDWTFIIRPEATTRRQLISVSAESVLQWKSYDDDLRSSHVADVATVLPDLWWFCAEVPGYHPNIPAWEIEPAATASIEAENIDVLRDIQQQLSSVHDRGRRIGQRVPGIVVDTPDDDKRFGRVQLATRGVVAFEERDEDTEFRVGDLVEGTLHQERQTVFASDLISVDDEMPVTEYITVTDREGESYRFPAVESRHPAAERYRFAYQLYQRWGEEIGNSEVSSATPAPTEEGYPNEWVGQTERDPEPSLEHAKSPRAYYYRTIAAHGDGEHGTEAKQAFEEACDVSIEAYMANFPTATDPDDLEREFCTVETGVKPWMDFQVPPEWMDRYEETNGIPSLKCSSEPLNRDHYGLPSDVFEVLSSLFDPEIRCPSSTHLSQIELVSSLDALANLRGIIPSARDFGTSPAYVTAIADEAYPIYLNKSDDWWVECEDRRFTSDQADFRLRICPKTESHGDGIRHHVRISNSRITNWQVSSTPSHPRVHEDEPIGVDSLDPDGFHFATLHRPDCVQIVEDVIGAISGYSFRTTRVTIVDDAAPAEPIPLETNYEFERTDTWVEKYRRADNHVQSLVDNCVKKMEDNMAHSGFNWSNRNGRYEYGRINEQYRIIIDRDTVNSRVTLVDFGDHDLPRKYGCY